MTDTQTPSLMLQTGIFGLDAKGTLPDFHQNLARIQITCNPGHK